MDDTRPSTQRAFRNVAPLAIWTLAWVATLALARSGPNCGTQQPVVSWIAVAVNVAVGIGWIVAHARCLRRVDDLQRKIRWMGWPSPSGWGSWAGSPTRSPNTAGLIAFDSDIAVLAVTHGRGLHRRHGRRDPEIPVKNHLKALGPNATGLRRIWPNA